MDNLPEQQKNDLKQRLKHIILTKQPECVFVASPHLQELLVKNEHPHIKAMPLHFKEVILNGPFRIKNTMVIDYIDGTLEAKNKFILDNGDIRISDNSISLQKGTI